MSDSPQVDRQVMQSGRAGIPAWCLSLLLHAAMMGGLILTIRSVPKGMIGEPDRSVGVSLVRSSASEREYLDESDFQDAYNEASSSTSNNVTAALPSAADLGIDLSGVLPSADGVSFQGGGLDLPNAADVGSAHSTNVGRIGGQAKTSVFGIQAEGSTFVYVFDRSTSMLGFNGRPLAAAKRELTASLNDLQETHQFQIIFYNDRPKIFQPAGMAPSLIWGDPSMKAQAKRFVEGINAFGATRHMDALRMALGMSPDVIFFLTDADEPTLTMEEMRTVERLNRGTTIHAIEFGFGPQGRQKSFLAVLAQRNMGQHAYINLAELAKDF
ncbi:MAG: hypothetical protein KDA87_10290 [Planctomycetales bacterium]|nr:hypothetical protein [Planctomycetales bacterium]